MAAVNILPGYAGAYTSESFTANPQNGADTLDFSQDGQLMFQVVWDASSPAPTGSVKMQQTCDGTHWSDISSTTVDVSTNGNIGYLSSGQGPFGLTRFVGAVTQGSVHLVAIGFPNSIRPV